MVMRLAATARKATPPLFETLSVLGRDMTRTPFARVRGFLKKVKSDREHPNPTQESRRYHARIKAIVFDGE